MASPEARKKKQVDLMLKRSKLEKGARNEASLIKSLKKKKGHSTLRWPFLEKYFCVPKMGFREIEKIEKLTKSLKDLALQD